MASTKNSQNPYQFDTFDAKSFAYARFFSLGNNTAQSFEQKITLIRLVCFLQQKMHAKDPEKYKNCLSLLQVIFGREFVQEGDHSNGEDSLLIGLSIICNDFLWGTTDEISIPEGFQTLKDVKNAIIKYITEEWTPF